MSTRTHWRSVRRAVAAIALGAFTTVAVALGCAVLDQGSPPRVREATRYPQPPDCGMKVKRFDSAGAFAIQVQTGTIIEAAPSPNSASGDVDRLVPHWARTPLVPWGWRGGWQIGQWSCHRLQATGWPMAAMWSTMKASVATPDGFGSWRVVEGISLDPPPAPGTFTTSIPRVLPVRPVLVGFVVDSAAFTVVWWWIFTAIAAMARRRRRRRGLCVDCGYVRRRIDSARRCPECGSSAT